MKFCTILEIYKNILIYYIMEFLHSESSRKIYHDNTTDLYLIAARRYAFWFLHKTYEENKLFKKEIQEEIKKADEKIKQFDEENQKKIREIIELYKWKDKHYGSQ